MKLKFAEHLVAMFEAQGVYYLGSTSQKNQEEGRGVYYYDFTSKIQTPIFIQEDGFINNFILLNK